MINSEKATNFEVFTRLSKAKTNRAISSNYCGLNQKNLNFNINIWIEFLGGNTAASQTGTGSIGSQATFYNMEKDMENNLLRRINELHRAQLEPLVKFLPLILDKLLLLMVKPPAFDGHILNVGPAAFNAIAMIVNKLTSSVSPFTLFFSVWEWEVNKVFSSTLKPKETF